jgi:hypothetical protein
MVVRGVMSAVGTNVTFSFVSRTALVRKAVKRRASIAQDSKSFILLAEFDLLMEKMRIRVV